MANARPLFSFAAFQPPARPLAEWLTFETMVERADLCDVPISPAQRALVRASQGLPVTHLDAPALAYHFGADGPALVPPSRPKLVVVRSGRRSGKSMLAALNALLFQSLTLPFRRDPAPTERPEADGLIGVRLGEFVRGVIVTPRLQQSRAAFAHAVGSLQRSPILSKYLHGKPKAESFELRRDDGHIVLIEMIAASPRGTNLRGSWFPGVVFDEAEFFNEKDKRINLRENYEAVRPAIIAGGQVWMPSSPYEDSGDFNAMHNEGWGKPGRILSFHSDSLTMNPAAIEAEELAAIRKIDPDFVAREYDAVPSSTSTEQFFPKSAIDKAMAHGRKVSLPPGDTPHWCGTDLGYSKNSSAIAFCRFEGGKVVLAYHEERVPGPEGLKPDEVARDFGKLAFEYSAHTLLGDGIYKAYAIEDFGGLTDKAGNSLTYEVFHAVVPRIYEAFSALRMLMLAGKVELTDDPQLRQQLEDTRIRKVSGGFAIAQSKRGTRHGDVLMAVVLAAMQVPANNADADDSNEWGGIVFGGKRRC